VNDIVFSDLTRTFISVSRDGSICSTNLQNESSRCIEMHEELVSMETLGGLGVAVGAKSGRIFLWDGNAPTANLIASLPGGLSKLRGDEGLVAATDDRGTLAVYQRDRGLSAPAIPCNGELTEVAVLATKGLVAASCKSGEILLWKLSTNQQGMVRLPRGKANGLKFSPNGENLLAACSDGYVREFRIDRIEYVPRAPEQLRSWLDARTSDKSKETEL
jgi:WD40 repeat protein